LPWRCPFGWSQHSCPYSHAVPSERRAPRHGRVQDALPQISTDTDADAVGKAHDRPELVIAGLDPAIAQALLNDLAERVVHRAARFTHGQRITDLIDGYDAVIIDGPITEHLYPGAAIGRYGPDRVRLQQIVWPDPHARFPWEPGYQYPPQAQPLLARS
jgi:Domain of unknown function (DUF4262)